ncbi:MAG: hypothetical protein NTV54_00230, partial [Ignavibacteriales bacterium]|nr:hypothetical protein [Ignavibacteriales bacterium]
MTIMNRHIEEILNFRFNASGFASFGRSLFVPETEKALRQTIFALDSLKRKATTLSRTTLADAPNIHDEFIRAAQSGYDHLITVFDSRRKVKKLSWSLNVKSDGRIPIIQTIYLP